MIRVRIVSPGRVLEHVEDETKRIRAFRRGSRRLPTHAMLDKSQLCNCAIEDAEPLAMVREFTTLSTKSLGCRERPARPPTPLDSANKDANAPTYSASPVSLSDKRRKSDSRQRGPLSLVR